MTKAIIILLLLQVSFIVSLTPEEYFNDLKKIKFKEVNEDLKTLFKNSVDWWPADYGTYAPFMIRLAWHCAGSYRLSDGRGGCDGGRQRFDPERSWDDNTNLDKARKLLWPIKQKYGSGLSWGDLLMLAGNAAIESMGGPVLGFCGGRVDDDDAEESLLLGPTPEQEKMFKCQVNGQCKDPFGANTIGLIYVNPEGPLGKPIPELSRHDVREVFGRMGMNDTETVSLIGGGHAFGKAHGACPTGAGKRPKEDEEHPWEGTCGAGKEKGKGKNTFTSGFEGAWTTNPTKFDNEFFKNLLKYKWEVFQGPGGHNQWRTSKKAYQPKAPKAHGKGSQPLMMLTTDISLTKDPEYLEIVKQFASNEEYFGQQFSHAWYKLATRDMGPYERCYGDMVPPPQEFQYQLPPPSPIQPDWTEVRKDIKELLYNKVDYLEADLRNDKPYYGAWFITLSYQCSSSYRRTDYTGGCNGSRIRFSPQKDYFENIGLNNALKYLESVKNKYGDKLSWSDLIVLSGTVALEDLTGDSYDFCGGRSDALDGIGSPHKKLDYPDLLSEFSQMQKLSGLNLREYVVLQGRARSSSNQKLKGFHGSWFSSKFDNEYFKNLLNDDWEKISDSEIQAKGVNNVFMTNRDYVLLLNDVIKSVLQEYADDIELFKSDFKAAWTKLMNFDRFDGPVHNKCQKQKQNLEYLS